MISETDLDFYRFTSSTTIFGLNKSVVGDAANLLI